MTTNDTPTPATHLSYQRIRPHVRMALRFGAVAVSTALISACGGGSEEGSGGTPEANESMQSSEVGLPLPDEAAHVHGVGVDPDSGEVLVATHAGLFHLPAPEEADGEKTAAEKVGPTIDLMGFSITGSGRFVASGHPGPDIDLPNPVGLIESRDGGKSWQPLSLQGQSDFHALSAGQERVVGFDGQMRATEDGTTWEDLGGSFTPFSLAVSDDGQAIVATTQQGPQHSRDGGAGFSPVEEAPPLVFVDWVPGTDSVYGVSLEGRIHRSDDAGATWTSTGGIEGEPQALHADADQLIVVADQQVSRSTDEGATFQGW
ncbi:MAG: hypothetical protein M0026_03825 [Nocardiopsaceae bacterium]|nr:hypothetical protein [Nocardiopsaceae bacterium]